MKIILENLSKRYNRQWIFKDISLELHSGNSYAITGPNGSGKSTLVNVLMGATPPTSGSFHYMINNKLIEEDKIYKYCMLASPYLELIEEFTLNELVKFHFKFKSPRENFDTKSIIEIAYLDKHRNKQIKNFSSGMKQRLKLALAFYSNTPFLFLDEPTSNLDSQGIDWYLEQVKLCADKLILVASNQTYEYDFCKSAIHIPNFVYS